MLHETLVGAMSEIQKYWQDQPGYCSLVEFIAKSQMDYGRIVSIDLILFDGQAFNGQFGLVVSHLSLRSQKGMVLTHRFMVNNGDARLIQTEDRQSNVSDATIFFKK